MTTKKQTGSATKSKSQGGAAMKAKSPGGSTMESKSPGSSATKSKPHRGGTMKSKQQGSSAMKSKPRRGGTMKSKHQGSSAMKSKPHRGGTLAVTGEGEVRVKPDIALLDLSVVTTSDTAQEAVRMNADRMASVISEIKLLGISAADIQTVGYNVSPIIDYDEKSPTFGKILEHRVDSQLRVRVDVEKAGQVIDSAINAGANMASGLRFGLRDEMSARTKALKAAVKAARRDADVIADTMAVRIQRPETIEINVGGSPIIMRSLMMEKASTPIESGTIDISASVRVVFRYS
jgi:uncharacterized protein YggE